MKDFDPLTGDEIFFISDRDLCSNCYSARCAKISHRILEFLPPRNYCFMPSEAGSARQQILNVRNILRTRVNVVGISA